MKIVVQFHHFMLCEIDIITCTHRFPTDTPECEVTRTELNGLNGEQRDRESTQVFTVQAKSSEFAVVLSIRLGSDQ